MDTPLSADLLEEQATYYRARAPVYDDWWEARRTDPRSAELRSAGLAERSRLEADLEEWCDRLSTVVGMTPEEIADVVHLRSTLMKGGEIYEDNDM